MFLMTSSLEFSILAMTCYSFSGSMTVSGLIRAMVKGKLTCFGSKSGYSIEKLYK